MLNLSVKTSLNPLESFDLAYDYFTKKVGLKVIELVGHMHAVSGFTEVRLSDGKLGGKENRDSRVVLREMLQHMANTYGLDTVHYLLHLHSVPDETVGHLVVKVTNTTPTEIEFTSEEYDEPVKEFAGSLRKP